MLATVVDLMPDTRTTLAAPRTSRVTPRRARRGRAGLAATQLLLHASALACHRGVPLPTEARPFTPPPHFARWWRMTEACSGRRGDFAAIDWYIVPDAYSVRARGESMAAYWYPAQDRIVVAGRWIADGAVVRHEMLHALLRTDGHPRAEFRDACGGVVGCDSACVVEGGVAPMLPDARPAQAGSLEVSVALDSPAPAAGTDGGAFSLVVSARNPHPYPVLVRPPVDPSGAGTGYRWYFWSPVFASGSRADVAAPDERVFGPGQTRHHVFDFVVGRAVPPERVPAGTSPLPPATYLIEGGLDGHVVRIEGVRLGP